MRSLHRRRRAWQPARRPQRHAFLPLAALAGLLSLLAGGLVACAPSGTTDIVGTVPTIVVRTSEPVTVPARGENFAIAKCLAGQQLVGGGYLLTPSSYPVAPYFSYPATSSIWSADVHNPTDAAMTITAYATCLQSATNVGMMTVTGAPTTLFGGAAGESSANCPAGAVVTGGGYSLTSGEMTLYIDASGPGDGQWLVDAHATTPSVTFEAYALCATQHLSAPAPHAHAALTLARPDDVGAAATTCPDATWLLTGGGFAKVAGESATVGASRPVLTTTLGSTSPAVPAWELGARNSSPAGSVAVHLVDFAICAHVIAELHPPTATPTETPLPTATLPPPPPTATTAPAAARIAVSPTAADAYCLNGPIPSITVQNTGGGTLHWSAVASAQSITISPSQGDLLAGIQVQITITGHYPGPSLSIQFTSNGGNATTTFACR